MIPKRLARIVALCARELDALGADWAIGGAVAMAAHGYVRATQDVDLFIGDDARDDLLTALKAHRLPMVPAMEPFHYAIVPDRRHPDARVDLLFPALGIESLALMAARRERIGRHSWPMWPIAHIIAQKLTTDPRIDPARGIKDGHDLQSLRDHGLIDPRQVGELLDDIGDRGAKRRLAALVRPARTPVDPPPPRRTRRSEV